MGKILDRIQKIASNEGITIGALERQIGASKGVLSRAINNGTDIQAKWIEVIVENYPHYSTRWLLTGKGDMISKASDSPMQETASSPIVGELLDRITNQAAEIGRLQERIKQLERQKGKSASGAQTSDLAHVG